MLNKIYSTHSARFKVCDSLQMDNGVTVPIVAGQVGQTGVVSNNGYRYKDDFWETILAQPTVTDIIKNRKMLGTIEHPKDDDEFMATSYENASHIVLKAWVQSHQPYAQFGLLNNQKGNSMKALIDVGLNPGVSTRGFGNFAKDNISKFVDTENYLLITWDFTKKPNFESLDMEPVTDSIMGSSMFRELCDAHGICDSAYTGFNRERTIQDMSKMIDELKEMITRLS